MRKLKLWSDLVKCQLQSCVSLDILYTGLAGDANRQYLCEQRLLPRTTSTQTASLTTAKNAISLRVLDVLTFARVKCNQKG